MDKHCLAPWTHTYLSPQSERRLCCASREPAQNFKQYIDTEAGSNEYKPATLEEHWNSDHMKSVRRRMMAGEELPECEVCNKKLLNTSVYRDYFNHMFSSKREDLLYRTDDDGTFHGKPISYDYRISNICTFKCRMCGPMLSSAWESEERNNNPEFENNNPWAVPAVKRNMTQFQRTVAVEELWAAIKEQRIQEIYWVGGEPLDWPEHWEMMRYMVEHNIAQDVYVRYNTNLSKVDNNGTNLYQLLSHFRDWQICASLDATSFIGEYIRTGLKYQEWVSHFSRGIDVSKTPRQMRIDLTLTLPGMMDIPAMVNLSNHYKAELLTKVTFAFTPDIVMSPLCLPRHLLEPLIDQYLSLLNFNSLQNSLANTLENLKNRPTFQEQWPDEYIMGLWKGKARIEELESRRQLPYNMQSILDINPKIGDWWRAI